VPPWRATLLQCYGWHLATVIAPLYVLLSLATAGILAARGKRSTAREIGTGLIWNVRELRRKLYLRRQVQRARRV
jgi:hypothetical protein